MTWSADDAREVLRVYRTSASRLVKRLNSALADPPPVSSGLDPSLQAAHYDKLALREAWTGLRTVAAKDQKDAEAALRTLVRRQAGLNRVDAERSRLPAPPAGAFKLNELPNWRKVRQGLISTAAGNGADEGFAQGYALHVGQVRIDVSNLSARADTVLTQQGEQLNALARSHLRRWAGASLCQVLARFNETQPAGPGDDSPGTHDALRDHEAAVRDALRSGDDGMAETKAYAAAATTELGRCVRRLRSLPDSSQALLGATLDTEEALEAHLLARYFGWFLGWGAGAGLDDGLRGLADLPFESPGAPWGVSLGAHRYRATGSEEWRVDSARCALAGTHIAATSGTGASGGIAVHNVDLAYFGFTGSGYLQLGPRVRRAKEDHLVDVPIAGSGPDWRSAIRQRVRGMYNPVPFGLSAAWSWQRGAHGAIAQVTNCGWFS